MKKGLIFALLLSLLWLGACSREESAAIIPPETPAVDDNNNDNQTINIPDFDDNDNEVDDVPQGDITFGSTFVLERRFSDDLFEVEIGSPDGVIWDEVDNRFSDLNGYRVFGVPVTITNVGDSTARFPSMTIFGPDGNTLERVHNFFSDVDVQRTGDMRSGASQDAYIMILFDGPGDYFIEFTGTDLEIHIPLSE